MWALNAQFKKLVLKVYPVILIIFRRRAEAQLFFKMTEIDLSSSAYSQLLQIRQKADCLQDKCITLIQITLKMIVLVYCRLVN